MTCNHIVADADHRLSFPEFMDLYRSNIASRIKNGNVIALKTVIGYFSGLEILDPDEWKVVKNMHEPLVSQKDFDKAQKRLQSNKKVKRVYPKHCLSGMVECGICGHNMRHANNGRPKYECAFTYFNINHKHARNSIIDVDIEAAVLSAMQKEFDLKTESESICEERKERQQGKIPG